jgi:MFS family permease
VHYGWIVVGAAFTVLLLAYGVQYSFGLFFTALTEEFGWSRASLSGVFSLYAAAYSFLGLVAGRLTDRWGPRAVITLGGALLGLGLALSGGIRALAPLYVTYLLAAVGMSSAYVPCNATVARWFETRRGLAVGLGLSGASAGTFVGPPLVALLIAEVGWRRAYVLLGTGLALSLGLLAGLFVRDPRDRGLAPYGAAQRSPSTPPAPEGWPVRRIVRHPSFALLVAVYTTTWIPVFMPPVHLVPLARDLGLSPVVGATALSALGAGSLLGRLGMGAVSDAIGRQPALVISLALQTLSFAGLAGAAGAVSLFGAAGAFGFAYGAVSALMPAVVTDFYGPAHAGSLVGLIFGLAGPAGGLGPVLAGWLFDTTGSYGAAFGLGAGLNLLALVLALLARPPAARPGGPRRGVRLRGKFAGRFPRAAARDTVVLVWALTLGLVTCLGIDFSNPLLPGVVRFGEEESVHALRAERPRSDERPTRALPRPPEPVGLVVVAMTSPRPSRGGLDLPRLRLAAGRPRASTESVRGAPAGAEDH